MGCYVLGDTHLDAILTAGLAYRTGVNHLVWRGEDGGFRYLTEATVDAVGVMLREANEAAFDAGSSDGAPEPARRPYRFRRLSGTTPDPVVVLRAIAGYTYQASEHPLWSDLEASRFCESLRRRAIGLLPGYADVASEIRDRNVFTVTGRRSAGSWPDPDARRRY